jgi:xylulokinase
MNEQYLLGVDIGTSSSKGVLLNSDLRVVETTRVSHRLLNPNPGWFEHDAEAVWWGDFVEIAQELVGQAEIDPDHIEGIGVSALHAAMVPLDATGDPLRPGILYGVDSRATEEIDIINNQIGEDRIYETSANALTSQSVGPKLLWYKRNEPEKFERTDKVLDALGYAVYKLTGEYTIDNAIAGLFDPLFDVPEIEWSTPMFDELDLPRDIVPENKWSTEIAGEVTPEASDETGLATGTPVIVGTGDAIASQVSVGAVDHGDAIFMYGTTGVIYATLGEARSNPNLWSFPHCFEGQYTMAGGMATSGSILEWFRDQFGGDAVQTSAVGKESYSTLNEQAATIDAGSDGLVLLPYFDGERTPMNDPLARGMLAGLKLSHTKSHVYRALLEGIGYGFRHHLDAMGNAGVPIDRVLAIGGGAQSDLWRQIVSNITGMTQHYVSNPLGSPLGAAYLAGLGTEMLGDLDAIRNETSVTARTEPNDEATRTYDEYYPIYRDLYTETRDSIHDLARLGDR